ncbi:MAG TPA: hypothetical protein VF772_18050, partial [Terriglobales bacterium]
TLEKVFWSPEKNYYVFAVDLEGNRIDRPSVLGAVPLWFGLTDQRKSDLFLNVIAAPDHQADWGPRIISNQDPLYSPTGYHFGSVWPLFTGWASVAGYRYHRPLYAYENLMANAQLAHDGSPGRTTEVLSGDFYTQLSTSTPHQIWSSAMVISPLLRGLMGLEVNALNSSVTFAPHVPAGWNEFAIRNVRVGPTRLDFVYHSVEENITLEVERRGTGSAQVIFSPALSLRTRAVSAEVDGKKVSSKIAANENDQHATISIPITSDKTTIRLRVSGNFGIAYPYAAPADGGVSSNIKIVSEQWNAAHDQLQIQIAGVGGKTYQLPVFNAPSGIGVQGGRFVKPSSGLALEVAFPRDPSTPGTFSTQSITLQFPAR